MSDHIIHLENGKLADDTPPARVAQTTQAAQAHSGPGGIVLHFHGAWSTRPAVEASPTGSARSI